MDIHVDNITTSLTMDSDASRPRLRRWSRVRNAQKLTCSSFVPIIPKPCNVPSKWFMEMKKRTTWEQLINNQQIKSVFGFFNPYLWTDSEKYAACTTASKQTSETWYSVSTSLATWWFVSPHVPMRFRVHLDPRCSISIVQHIVL